MSDIFELQDDLLAAPQNFEWILRNKGCQGTRVNWNGAQWAFMSRSYTEDLYRYMWTLLFNNMSHMNEFKTKYTHKLLCSTNNKADSWLMEPHILALRGKFIEKFLILGGL